MEIHHCSLSSGHNSSLERERDNSAMCRMTCRCYVSHSTKEQPFNRHLLQSQHCFIGVICMFLQQQGSLQMLGLSTMRSDVHIFWRPQYHDVESLVHVASSIENNFAFRLIIVCHHMYEIQLKKSIRKTCLRVRARATFYQSL